MRYRKLFARLKTYSKKNLLQNHDNLGKLQFRCKIPFQSILQSYYHVYNRKFAKSYHWKKYLETSQTLTMKNTPSASNKNSYKLVRMHQNRTHLHLTAPTFLRLTVKRNFAILLETIQTGKKRIPFCLQIRKISFFLILKNTTDRCPSNQTNKEGDPVVFLSFQVHNSFPSITTDLLN